MERYVKLAKLESLASASADAPADATKPAVRITRLSDPVQLATLTTKWNRLAGDIPFRQWELLEAWWRHLSEHRDELFVLLAHDARGRLIGIAPWFCRPSKGFGRVIRWLGSGIVCSDYLSILVEEKDRSEVVAAIYEWLIHEEPTQWDALDLEAVDASDQTIAELLEHFTTAGHRVERTAAPHCWRLELGSEWDAYVKELSSSRRGMVRKLDRRCFQTGMAQVRRVNNAEQFEDGFAILVHLHQRRRTSLGERGCFAVPGFTEFLKLAARRFFDLNRLQLQWIELEGRFAAVEIDFIGGDTLYLYQSGIEPELMDARPGWLGTMATLRGAIRDGYRCYDFLRGDEPYKAHWRGVALPLTNVRVACKRRTAEWRHGLWSSMNQAKQLVKRARKDRTATSEASNSSSDADPAVLSPAHERILS